MILLDAINQFDPTSQLAGWSWLPEELPGNARIIFSTISNVEGQMSEVSQGVETLRHRRNPSKEIELKPLTAEDANAIVREFLHRYRKSMTDDQRAALLAKADSGTPLYLLVALEELRTLSVSRQVTDSRDQERAVLELIAQLPPDTRALFIWILKRLEDDDGFRDDSGQKTGRELVSRFVSLMCASRHGLSQQELVELLAPGDPQGNVAALAQLLRPYLMQRGELLDFYHGQFRAAAATSYLQSESQRLAAHDQLAAYFRDKADPTITGMWDGKYPRGLHELPHHLLEGKLSHIIYDVACDERFLNAQEVAFPSNPDLTLQTLRYAYLAAANEDNAARMAEFILRHARSVAQTTQESPLGAMRLGNSERAWKLADLHEIERCTLWHLLLASVLNDLQDHDNAKKSLKRLSNRILQRLSGWQGRVAANLLFLVFETDQQLSSNLQESLLDDDNRIDLCQLLVNAGHLDHAITISECLSNVRHRVKALVTIAEWQVEAGNQSAADSAFMQAFQIAKSAERTTRAEALQDIVQAHARAGGFKQALHAAWCIDDPTCRGIARATIAIAQARAGDSEAALFTISEALHTKRQIPSTEDMGTLLSAVAQAQAATTNFKEALETARFIHLSRAGGGEANTAYSTIAAEQLRAGDHTGAWNTIQNVTGWRRQVAVRDLVNAKISTGEIGEVLRHARTVEVAEDREIIEKTVAEAYSSTGNREAAQSALMRAVEAAAQTEKYKRARRLGSIAVAQARMGDTIAARSTFKRAHLAAEKLGSADALRDVVAAQSLAGWLKEARKTTREIDWDWKEARSKAHWAIAAAMAASGEFALAFRSVKGLQLGHDWINALGMLACLTLGEDERKAAQEAFSWALEFSIEDKWLEPWSYAITDIAVERSQTGDASEAHAAFALALRTAQPIHHHPELWIEMLAAIGEQQTRQGDVIGAAEVFAKGREFAELVDDTLLRIRMLAALILAQARASSKMEKSSFRDLVRKASGLENGSTRADALSTIATAQAQAGDFEGCAKTLREIDDSDTHWEERALDAANSAIAIAQARAGMFDAAMKTAKKLPEPDDQAAALAVIAEVQAASGLLADALTTAQKIRNPFASSDALAAIASAQARRGQICEAIETSKDVLSTADLIRVLAAIAVSQKQASDHNAARATFDKAGQYAKNIHDAAQRAITFGDLVMAYFEAGDDNGALESLADMWISIQSVEDGKQRASVIAAISINYFKVGLGGQAVSIEEGIITNRNKHLPAIAAALAAVEDREHFKRVLILCAYYPDAAYRTCGLLAKLYPKQASALAEVAIGLSGDLDVH